jgi:hypothetical protein
MSIPIRPGARLLFRVDPLPGESPRGYLCRVAHEHSYRGPFSLAQIAGLPPSGLDREDRVEQIAYVLRLAPEEWRAMCYRHIKRREGFDQRSFYGKRISPNISYVSKNLSEYQRRQDQKRPPRVSFTTLSRSVNDRNGGGLYDDRV